MFHLTGKVTVVIDRNNGLAAGHQITTRPRSTRFQGKQVAAIAAQFLTGRVATQPVVAS